MKWPSALAAMRHPNFRLWFAGQTISLVGTWMQSVAQQWVVYAITGSKFLLGAVVFANSIPNLFLMLPAGVLADRFSRRKLLMATQTFMMALAFVMAALLALGKLQIWHIFVLAVLLGVANAFDAPPRLALAVELVDDRRDLMNAIALNSTIFNLARVIGPAVAGLVLAAWGAVWCFSLNGISFIAVLIGLMLMRLTPAPSAEHGEPVGQVLEGLRYSIRHAVIFPLLLIAAVSTLCAAAYTSLMPVFAADVLRVGEAGYGLLTAAVGVGALIGSLTMAAVSRWGRIGRLLFAGSLIFPLAQIAFSLSTRFEFSLAMLAVTGFGFVIQNASINTIIQTDVSDELRGRVLSLYSLAFFGSMPFGALLSGSLAQWVSPQFAVMSLAILGLAFAVTLYLLKPALRRISSTDKQLP